MPDFVRLCGCKKKAFPGHYLQPDSCVSRGGAPPSKKRPPAASSSQYGFLGSVTGMGGGAFPSCIVTEHRYTEALFVLLGVDGVARWRYLVCFSNGLYDKKC
jgi:hypothetical protein